MLFCMRVTATGSWTRLSGIERRMIWSDLGPEKPGSTLSIALKVRIMSTALMSSTSAMATCAMTSTLRPRCRSRLALDVRVAPSNDMPWGEKTYRTTGMKPKNNPQSTESSIVKMIERASREISLSRGRLDGPICFNKSVRAHAMMRPAMPPEKPKGNAFE